MNKKTFATLALVLALLPICTLFIPTKGLDVISIIVTVSVICEILAVIFAIIGMKASKGKCIASIIIGLIAIIIGSLALFGISAIKNAKDCVDNGDGKATCKVLGQDIELDMKLLKDSQMK